MSSRLVRSSVNTGLLVLVNIGWASQWTAYKLVGDDLGPITISFLTFVLAMPIVLPLCLAERRRWRSADPPAPCVERSLWRWDNLAGFLVGGVLGLAPASVLGAWGLLRTTASNASLLTLTVPVMTALLAAVILHERMTAVRWVSLAIALAGVLILSVKPPESAAKEGLAVDWHDLGLFNKDFVAGNLLVLASCMCSCLYNVCSKGLLRRFFALEVLTASYFLALATSAAMLVWFEPLSPSVLLTYSARTWTGLLLLGGVSFGAAMVLWFFLLKRLDVSQASVSTYLQPFFGVLLAAICLREEITLPMMIGGAITLLGTILVVSTENTE